MIDPPVSRRRMLGWLGAASAVPFVAACGTADAATYPVRHTDAEWKQLLTPAQYYILRQQGTERPYTSPLLAEHRKGTFVCAADGNPLYASSTKFDSGTGWPSFWKPLPRRDRHHARPVARHPAHRSPLRALRRPSRPRVRGRAAADRAAVLHERRWDEVPARLNSPGGAGACLAPTRFPSPPRSPIRAGFMRAPTPSPFRAELGATLRLAAPLALANLLQMAVYASDVIFVARLGQEQLAASSLAVALFGVIAFGLTGLTGAAAPLIAAELGRKRNSVREVRRSLRMALWLAVLSSFFGIALCFAGERIFVATGQIPALAHTSGWFIRILAAALIPMMVSNVLRIFVAALGRPVFATAITAGAIAVNAAGNWLLIFGNLGAPKLGLQGSATASVITAFVTMAAYVAAILTDRKLRRFHPLGRWWRPEWRRLREMLRIGLPIAATIVAEGGLFSSAAFLMGLIGETALAAHAVALQIGAFFFQVPYGVGQAATIRVGYHFGAGDRRAIGHAGWAALVTGMTFAGLSASLMLFAPRFILGLYVDVSSTANAALIALAVRFLTIAAAFQFADGVQAIAAGALRGLQDTRIPMVVAIAGYWLCGFATAATLGLTTPLQGVGVWIGLAVGLRGGRDPAAVALVVARALAPGREPVLRPARAVGKLSLACNKSDSRLDGPLAADHMRGVGTLVLGVPTFIHQRMRENPMTFRPLHDRVLVRRVEAEEKTAGGIIIPDSAKEKPAEGEIVAAGTGARAEDGKVTPLDVQVG